MKPEATLPYSILTIGILALQGDFEKHAEVLRLLGAAVIEVRKPEQLDLCDGLIIPGGESTVMLRQMDFIRLREKFKAFAMNQPVFGTCAGLILMSREVIGYPMVPFNLIHVDVERNAFGRQAESFITEVEVHLARRKIKMIPSVFIRAPRIRKYGSEVKVLATFQNEPVLVQQGNHLGATFHPELTSDVTIHRYFLELVLKRKR